jgi:hypothetical protein
MAVIKTQNVHWPVLLQLLGTKLHQHPASAPAQSNESDFQCRRSEIAELRPQHRPGHATNQRPETQSPKTQSRVVQQLAAAGIAGLAPN